MKKYLEGRIVRIRCEKNYPEAHTHILIGKVIEENSAYLVIEGRTFHFRNLNCTHGVVQRDRSNIHSGEVSIRCLPWHKIEIIHQLPGKTDCGADYGFDDNGDLRLHDAPATLIAGRLELIHFPS